MKDTITSLCYISKRNTSSVELCRIADLDNGFFVPYHYDNTIDFYDTERDLLYGSATRLFDSIGSIGVFDWYSYQDTNNAWKTNVDRSRAPWTEVVLSNCASPQDIVNVIKNGWKYNSTYDKQHDIIICCAGERPATQSVYLPKEALSVTNDIITFASSTFNVDVGVLDYKRSTESCRCRYSSYDSRRYLTHDEAWRKTGQIVIKSIDEIIEAIVGDQINSFEKDVLPRRDRQAAKAALKKLNVPTMEQKVAEKLNCNIEQAQKYVSDYIKTRDDLLTHDRITDLIEVLIESNSKAVADMRDIIEKNWESVNADRIAAAQQDIVAANDVLQKIKNDQTRAKNELTSLEESKKKAEAQTEEAMQMQFDVEAEINRRLEEIRTNKVAALVDDAFLCAKISRQMEKTETPKSGNSVNTLHVAAPKGYNIFAKQSESPTTDTLSENFGVLADSLEHYCAPGFSCRGLLLYLFASFSCHQHLIFTGETGEALAVAYAAAIAGVQCPIVSISGDADVDAIVAELEQLPHTIVAVRETVPTGYEIVRQLMRRFPNTQFLLLVDHEESLLMEPMSFFTTFAPVLTDLFCQSSEIPVATGYECVQELLNEKVAKVSPKELLAEKSKYRKWFDGGFTAPLLENRCAQILIVMRRLTKQAGMAYSDAEPAAITYLYIPMIKCLQRRNKLSERIKAYTGFNNETKTAMISFCGIEEE